MGSINSILMLSFLLAVMFLITDGLSTLMICIFTGTLTAIVRRFCTTKIPSIQTVLRILFIGVAVLIIAYNASRSYTGLWTGLAFEGNKGASNEMLIREYWYRIFAAPFFSKECYLCGQDCEQWRSQPYLLASTNQSACPITLSHYYDREVFPDERNVGFIASIIWGLLAIPLSFGIEKGIHHLLLKILPIR